MTNKNHKSFATVLLALATVLSLLTTSCERKELWLPSKQANIDIAIYDIDLELYFGIDWRYEWQYDWPEEDPDYGPIGYSEPYGVQATIYNLDGINGARRSPFTKHMTINGRNQVSLNAANWYDMLFYNYDYEYILTDYDEGSYTYYNMTTRATGANSRSFFPSTRDGQTTVPDSVKAYSTYNQPDEMFGIFLRDLYVSEDPEDYEETIDDSGNTVYIYRIDATLEPYTFIYLIQPVIINNYIDTDDPVNPDPSARIRSISGLSITGLAQGVELYTRKDWKNAISIVSEDIKPMQVHKQFRFSDGTVQDADVCAARVLTWGLPGIDPLEARRVLNETGVAPENPEGNWIGLNLVLRGGKTYPVAVNISDQIANHPTGGIITVVINAGDIDRAIIDEKANPSSGGGFNASVDNWENEVVGEVTI